MTPLAMLLYLQETLPPPPEPTGTPDINTAQVVGIVILSLGLIVIAALALRPLVGRNKQAEAPEAEPTPPEKSTEFEPVVRRPLLQFPTPPVRTPEPETEWDEADPVVEERFGRILGEPVNRRKLGDRRPTRRAHDLAVAALHRVDTDPHAQNGSRVTAIAERLVVPMDERRMGVVDRVPQGQILQWQGTIIPEPAVADPAVDAGERLEESFANWPANDRVISARTPASAVSKGDDATQEFIVVTRDQAEDERPAAAAEVEYGLDIVGVDTSTLAEISQVLRDLIYCANSGQLFHGFALYSDPYLFRFMDGTGLTEDEFREIYGSIGSRPPEAWERLDRLSDVVRRPDGKIEATVSYVDVAGKPINGQERFRFALDTERGVWMIDDIATIEEPA